MLTCETNPWLTSGKKKPAQNFLRIFESGTQRKFICTQSVSPITVFFYDGGSLEYVCSPRFDYLKPPAKRARFSAINEGYVSLKKAAWRVLRKRCAKMHKIAFWGGVCEMCTKKNVP